MSGPGAPYQHHPDGDTLHDVCPRCGALFGACKLTCPALRLPAGYRITDDQEATS